MSLNSTVCALEGAARIPYVHSAPKIPVEDKCVCVEQFGGGGRGGGRGGGGGGRGGGGRGGGGRGGGGHRGGGHGGWSRGYRNWRGGYSGFGYYPYWYGSYYYLPDYYDYPYVSQPPYLTEVVGPGMINGHLGYILAFVALVVAFLALRK